MICNPDLRPVSLVSIENWCAGQIAEDLCFLRRVGLEQRAHKSFQLRLKSVREVVVCGRRSKSFQL